jgi:hypothetical protein
MIRPMRPLAWVVACFGVLGCSANPPANWAKGGAPLDIPRARWVFGSTLVEVVQDGKVIVGGEHTLTIDRGGRVFDPDREPVALLEPDGKLIGPDDESMGVVGALHASRADEPHAWISVAPSGEVIIYDDEGERRVAGVWIGCNATPRTHQVCTLVSHLLALRMRANAERGGGEPSVGIGIGVGIGVGR